MAVDISMVQNSHDIIRTMETLPTLRASLLGGMGALPEKDVGISMEHIHTI